MKKIIFSLFIIFICLSVVSVFSQKNKFKDHPYKIVIKNEMTQAESIISEVIKLDCGQDIHWINYGDYAQTSVPNINYGHKIIMEVWTGNNRIARQSLGRISWYAQDIFVRVFKKNGNYRFMVIGANDKILKKGFFKPTKK